MAQARLVCPECEHEEDPVRHTLYSSCGGDIAWDGARLVCQDCGQRIYSFRCEECGEHLGEHNCE